VALSASYSHSRQVQAAKILKSRWENDPERFAYEALKIRALASDQKRLLAAVAEHRRVACKSGQKTGKSTALAVLSIWWPLTRYRGYCLITAPTFAQVKDPLWKEIARLRSEAEAGGIALGGQWSRDPSTGWVWPYDRKIFARTTAEPERLQGISSPNLLVLVDEASGFAQDLWAPLVGNLIGGGKLCATSNPTEASGEFFDAFTKNAEHWFPLTFRSDETPNYVEGRRVIPGLAMREDVDAIRAENGEKSSIYQTRVLGEFPTQGDNAVVAYGLVVAGQKRYVETTAAGRLHFGVDVARFGDDETVIRPRRGLKALKPTVLQGYDNVDVAGRVLELARELRSGREIPLVKIDEIGNGSGVVDVLSRSEEVEVRGVNVAENATAEGYHRMRDQLWFALASWLREGGAIEDDPRLLSELVAPTYGFDVQGRAQVESKDEIKLRLGRSPDRADALALSIFEPPERDLGIGTSRSSRRW
jgi:phage terminase large subunit